MLYMCTSVRGCIGINYYCATDSNYDTSALLTKLYCQAPIKINSVISDGDSSSVSSSEFIF